MRHHGRNEKLRTLNRLEVWQGNPHSVDAGDGKRRTDYTRPVYYVRPRGFSTTLFKIEKYDGTDCRDFECFMNAVMRLCHIPAPK